MDISKKIEKLLNLRFCSSIELEYVDEGNTTLKILIKEENEICFPLNLFHKEKVIVILSSLFQLRDKVLILNTKKRSNYLKKFLLSGIIFLIDFIKHFASF
jgi:hypothetical protein